MASINEDRITQAELLKKTQQQLAQLEQQLQDQQQELEQLRQREQRFRSLYLKMSEGAALHQLVFDENGQPFDYEILDVNPSFERILGIPAKEAIGALSSQVYHIDPPPLLDRYQQVALDGDPMVFECYIPEMKRYFRVRAFCYADRQFVTVFEDISKRKESEERLRHSEELFRAITEAAQDSIFCKDLQRRYTFVNPAMTRVFNCKAEDLLGKTPEELFDPQSATAVKEADLPVLKGNVVDQVRTLTIAGENISFHTIQVPLRDEQGEVRGICGFVRNVTHKREEEAQQRHQQKLEAIGTLASGVAHEINNPINIILNFAELIQDYSKPEDRVFEYASDIVRESRRIADIVYNLLSFSRQESEAHSPALIGDIIQSTLALTRKVLSKDQIDLVVHIDENLPKINCRSQQIMQVFMNLLNNARDTLNQKYPSHHDDKRIEICSKLFSDEQNKWIRTTIEDHGMGIDIEMQERIFTPFYTTKQPGKGTGLGLSVSHGIIADHFGRMSIESKPGTYTRFHIDLPLTAPWTRSNSEHEVETGE